MKVKLIQNWRRAWRLLTVQIATLALGFGLLPPDQQASLLALLGITPGRVPAVIAVLFLLARLIDQPKTRGE